MKFEIVVTLLVLYPIILSGAIYLFGKYSVKPKQNGVETGSTDIVQASGVYRRRTRNSRKFINANDNFANEDYALAA